MNNLKIKEICSKICKEENCLCRYCERNIICIDVCSGNSFDVVYPMKDKVCETFLDWARRLIGKAT